MKRFVSTFVLLMTILWTQLVLAKDPTKEHCQPDCVTVGEWSFAVGIGYGGRTNPLFGRDDVPIYIVPEVSYYGEKFFLENFDLGYTLHDGENSQVNLLLLTPGFEHIFHDDNSIGRFTLDARSFNGVEQSTLDGLTDADFKKLDDRRMAGLSGFEAFYFYNGIEMHIQAMADVTGVHDGEKVRLAFSKPMNLFDGRFLATAGLAYQSKSLLDYYYGLDEHEVPIPDLAYEADSGVSSYLRFDWRKKISKKWVFRSVVSYKFLSSSVKDSPIVDEDAVLTYYVGGMYHF